jgi:hypothetical protein
MELVEDAKERAGDGVSSSALLVWMTTKNASVLELRDRDQHRR